jgi:hypothetical protein
MTGLLPQPPEPPDTTPLFLLVDSTGKIVQACQLRPDAERALDMRTKLLGQTLELRQGTAQDLPRQEKNASRKTARSLSPLEPEKP